MVWWRLKRAVRLWGLKYPEHQAVVYRRRLNIAYAFITWNLIFFLGYQFMKGKGDWASYYGLEKQRGTPAAQFAYNMDIPKAKVLRFSGFQKVDEYQFENRKDIEEFAEFEALDRKENVTKAVEIE